MQNLSVLIVQEVDCYDGEKNILFACDSVKKARELIKEYYGEYKTIKSEDVRDSSLEFIKKIKLPDGQTFRVYATWYRINEL